MQPPQNEQDRNAERHHDDQDRDEAWQQFLR